MNKKVLVTGGSGFLGSHLIDSLIVSGFNVINFDTKESNFNIKGVQNIKGDLLDFNLLKNSLKNIDFVYHLAAFSDLDKAKDDPIKTMNINVLGTTNLLQAAKINQVNKVIFASSIYVNSRTGGFYRVSKHSCEILLEEFYNYYKLNYTILRFGTIFGPRSDNSNSVYNYLLSALKNKSIDAVGSGNEVREYIDVRDAAKVCEQAMLDKYNNEAIVVTGNHRIKLNELLEMIREILNNDIEIKYGEGKAAHYKYTPYSFTPRPGKKIVLDSFRDFGQGLVEVLEEIDKNTRLNK
jgi:UDP-glucose 4-epimerase